MDNYQNKITGEEAKNLIALQIAKLTALIEEGYGNRLSIPLAGDSLTSQLNAIEASITVIQGDVSSNQDDIATNTADIATNTANIATNASDILTNANDIAALEALDPRAVVSSDTTIKIITTDPTEYNLSLTALAANTTVVNSEPDYVLAVTLTDTGEYTYTLKSRTMPAQAMSAFAAGVAAGSVTPSVIKTKTGPYRLVGDFALTNFVINWDLSANDGQESAWMNIATLPATYSPSGEGSLVSLVPSTTIYSPIVIFATETSSLTEAVNLIGVLRVTNAGSVDIKVATPYRFVISGTAIEEGFVLASGTDWTGQYTGTLYLQSVTWDWE